MKSFIFNGLGIIGVFLVLFAYYMLHLGKMAAKSFNYPFLNLCGSLLILISLFYSWNFPAFIIQTAWAVISMYGLLKYFSAKKQG
jgi:hypothetical protein